MMDKEKNNGCQVFLLRDVLVRLGISQRKLAKMMGATPDWIGRFYHGRNAPSWPTVVKISRVLGVSVGVFADNDPARLAFFTRATPDFNGAGPAPPAKAAARARRPRKASA